ncbi:MAG: carbamate kinase [candidate division WOR-3 bacterium]|nr:carbamate kinase [candidate division WOR-3 bacterium]MCX7947254.1 carbamate kinase [candidate division WOR-3 bacterium]MDW8150189.1 carbamate kinase [candidate division WOR-3 bacterium]
MRVVIALGGNALVRKNEPFNTETHDINSHLAIKSISKIIENNEIVITHGNGPQVGEEFFRNVFTIGKVFTMSLDYLNAQTQGWIGYLLEKHIRNETTKKVATLVTLVRIDPNDEAFLEPTKFIGRFFDENEMKEYSLKYGWKFKKDSNRGYRVVVPSPKPKEILNKDAILNLIENGFVVVALGGGGIPVVLEHDKYIRGVEAVIDKDLASSLLAIEINADLFMILTEVEKVYLNYNKENQKALDVINVNQLEKYYYEGHFPEGSMGPKVLAAMNFVKATKRKAIITSLDKALDGFYEKTGTIVIP